MTGNTKIWRAPLAGLASVAMIATMGMAAATANAAGTELAFVFDGDTVATYKDADGTITQADLVTAVQAANTAVAQKLGSDVLTGWFTSEAVGSGEAVASIFANKGGYSYNPNGTKATTVYAHVDADPYTVIFDRDGVTGGIGDTLLAFNDSNNALDVLADWQIPTTDTQAGDGKVMYDKNGNYAVSGNTTAYWKSSTSEAPVEPAEDLYAQGAFKIAGDTVQHEITLTPVPVAARALTFSTSDALTTQTEAYTLTQADGITPYSTATFDVAVGAKLGDYVDFPRASYTASGSVKKEASSWKSTQDNDEDVVAKFPSYTVNDQMPGNDLTLYPTDAGAYTFVTLHYRDKATNETTKLTSVEAGQKYAVPADLDDITVDGVTYTFAGWYTYDTTHSTYQDEYTVASDKPASDLYAKWDVASVDYTFDPVYTDPVTVTVKNGKQLTIPTFDRGDDWAITSWGSTELVAADKANLYMTCDGTAYGTVTVKYRDAADGSEQTLSGTKFTAVWTESSKLPGLLTEMEGYVTIEKRNGDGDTVYIKGSEQEDFTAASFDAYVSAFQEYKKNQPATLSTAADYQAQITKLAAIQAELVEVGDTDLYRLYNPGNGDHYFITNGTVAQNLVALGWRAEGAPYKVVTAGIDPTDDVAKRIIGSTTAGATYGNHAFGTAIWSVYNPNTGEHLLTSEGEADALDAAGWNKEQIQFYTVQNGSEDVMRVYNPNTNGPAHLYTDASEANGLAAQGWKIDNYGKPMFTLD